MSDAWRVVPKQRTLASGIIQELQPDGTWVEVYRPAYMTPEVPPNSGPYQKPAKKGER